MQRTADLTSSATRVPLGAAVAAARTAGKQLAGAAAILAVVCTAGTLASRLVVDGEYQATLGAFWLAVAVLGWMLEAWVSLSVLSLAAGGRPPSAALVTERFLRFGGARLLILVASAVGLYALVVPGILVYIGLAFLPITLLALDSSSGNRWGYALTVARRQWPTVLSVLGLQAAVGVGLVVLLVAVQVTVFPDASPDSTALIPFNIMGSVVFNFVGVAGGGALAGVWVRDRELNAGMPVARSLHDLFPALRRLQSDRSAADRGGLRAFLAVVAGVVGGGVAVVVTKFSTWVGSALAAPSFRLMDKDPLEAMRRERMEELIREFGEGVIPWRIGILTLVAIAFTRWQRTGRTGGPVVVTLLAVLVGLHLVGDMPAYYPLALLLPVLAWLRPREAVWVLVPLVALSEAWMTRAFTEAPFNRNDVDASAWWLFGLSLLPIFAVPSLANLVPPARQPLVDDKAADAADEPEDGGVAPPRTRDVPLAPVVQALLEPLPTPVPREARPGSTPSDGTAPRPDDDLILDDDLVLEEDPASEWDDGPTRILRTPDG